MTNVVGTGNSLYGQSGDMPIDMYLRKIEQTCMYESPTQIEDYQRGILKDFKPDEPFFESDQKRNTNQSTQRINLRSGATTLTDPYLPEGSFTDWQFLEKDPRGHVTEPDMRKHVKQQYSRGGNYKYGYDEDNSVPSEGINPLDMQMNVRNSQTITKDYFNIFDTSFDGRGNRGSVPTFKSSVKQNLYNDQVIKDPVHAPSINRVCATNNLSNDTSIGWRRTVDHKFKVAKYGRNITNKDRATDNWWRNRANAQNDHDVMVSIEEKNVPKSIALKMVDLIEQSNIKKEVGFHGIKFGKETKQQNKKIKLTPADMAGMANRPTKETQDETPNAKINGELKNVSGERLIIHDVKTIEKTHINPTIVEKMSSINRNSIREKKDDLRNSIKKSTEDKGIYLEDVNVKKKDKYDTKALWNSLNGIKKGESFVVKNFKAAVTKIEEGGKKLEKISKDIDFKESYKTNQRRGKIDSAKSMTTDSTKIDNDFGREVARAHLTGPMGSKYMNKYMDNDTDHNDINDSAGLNKTSTKSSGKKTYSLR